MTDMEIIDSTEGAETEKKSGYAAMREKYEGKISDIQAKLDAEVAARAADKKLYFANTMKNLGYEGDFNEFADKYSSLDINDMVSLYEGQHGRINAPQGEQPQATASSNVGPQSVIAGANPTAEVGAKSIKDMKPDELIKFAKTQSRYHGG